jgi:hypothetical protein
VVKVIALHVGIVLHPSKTAKAQDVAVDYF